MAVTAHKACATVTDAFNDDDLDRLARSLADDLVFRAPGADGDRSACIQFFKNCLDSFPDARLDVHDLHVLDNVVLEEGKFTGTHTGVARTGRPVSLDYFQLLRVRDGRHVSLHLILDRLLMLEQLGLTDDEALGS